MPFSQPAVPLTHGVTRIAIAAALAAVPAMIGMLASTGTATMTGSGTFGTPDSKICNKINPHLDPPPSPPLHQAIT